MYYFEEVLGFLQYFNFFSVWGFNLGSFMHKLKMPINSGTWKCVYFGSNLPN